MTQASPTIAERDTYAIWELDHGSQSSKLVMELESIIFDKNFEVFKNIISELFE